MSSQTVMQAAAQLTSGKTLDVDISIAEEALASAIKGFVSYISPMRDDGVHGFSVFKKLVDNAGLPSDHPALRVWIALRAIAPSPGDTVDLQIACPVSRSLIIAIGSQVGDQNPIASIASANAPNPTVSSAPVIFELSDTDLGSAISTPAGFISVIGSVSNTTTTNTAGWKQAILQAQTIASILGRKDYDANPNAVIELAYTRPSNDLMFEGDAIHENWQPEMAVHKDLKLHPAALIQSATLATVRAPEISYRPRLTRHVIRTGLLSNAQFEAVAAIGEAHTRHLPNDERVGFVLADGTGAGKTNSCLGVILDNILRGRTKAIIVLEKRRHAPGFISTWKKMNRAEREFIMHWDAPEGQKIPDRPGILLTTYSLLRQSDSHNTLVRLPQIINWAGSDFDGALIFDEAQNMRNAAGSLALDNKSETSAQGLAGLQIQELLPEARVVYASATAFSDVHNLAYCTRLGLWGEQTSFKDNAAFIRSFQQGTISDLEQVMMSVKAAGCTISRNLSYDGVTQQILPYTLDKNERALFNTIAEMWGKLAKAADHTTKLCNVPSSFRNETQKSKRRASSPFSHLTGMYESNRKRSMETVISSFKTRGVIEDIKVQLAAGNCAVVQLQNTYEAQLQRMLDKNQDVNNIRLEPSEMISFVEALPEIEHKIVNILVNGKPSVTYSPVMYNGQPLINQEAAALKADLIKQIKAIEMPLPPLDQLMMTFGTDRVAEMTGRSRRIIPRNRTGLVPGVNEFMVEERSEDERLRDVDAFQSGAKPILVFSTGAGGSSLSYHAVRNSKNEKRRIHYLVQLGYRADQVAQGTGRTHRSDEAIAPHYMIVTADLPADRLYASRIVSAMFRLGALSNGHRHAANNGMFEERDCLEGPYADAAMQSLVRDINDQKLTGDLAHYTGEQFAADLGIAAPVAPTHGLHLLNRIAALTDRRQNALFNELRDRIDREIEKAIAEGRFNAGPETLTAKSFDIISESEAIVDTIHQSKTRVYRVRKTTEADITTFLQAHKIYMLGRNKPNRRPLYARHQSSGTIALINPLMPTRDMFGDSIYEVEIITPTNKTRRTEGRFRREPWVPIPDIDRVEGYWNAAIDGAPKTSTSYITLVTDALLPVWKALRRSGLMKTNVYRIQTSNGKALIGRPVPADTLPDLMNDINSPEIIADTELQVMFEHLEQDQTLAQATEHWNASHMIIPVLDNNDQLAGFDMILGRMASTKLKNVLLNTGGCQINEQPGNRFIVTRNRATMKEVLRNILNCSPVQYVEGMALAEKQALAAVTTGNPAQPTANTPAINGAAATPSTISNDDDDQNASTALVVNG